MNKRIFYLIILLLILTSIFTMKFYLQTKREVLEENNRLVLLESKVKRVYALKEKYRFNTSLFNRLKNFCEINDKGDKYLVVCKNLNSNKFNTVQNIIFKHNFKITKFNIFKDKLANIEVEINK